MEMLVADRDRRIEVLERAVASAEAAAGVSSAPAVFSSEAPGGGMPQLTIRGGNSEATVYLHGAHVTSWRVGGEEQLFVSKQAIFAPPKAIRGGIPVCWPQFSDMGPLGQHGFARNTKWRVKASPAASAAAVDGSRCVLVLSRDDVKDAGALAAWPWPFEVEMRLAVSDDAFTQELVVTNTGSEAFAFTAALHTYFAVGSIAATSVEGLEGLTYLDNLDGRSPKVDGSSAVRFAEEVDRIYLAAPRAWAVVCEGGGGASERRVVGCATSEGLCDAVVWNPWAAKAKSLADFGDDEYERMVCVEAARCRPSEGTSLAPGDSWSGKQTLTAHTGPGKQRGAAAQQR